MKRKRSSTARDGSGDDQTSTSGIGILPLELLAHCLSSFGKSRLGSFELEEERERRDLLATLQLVSKEWRELARPLLLDHVLLETLRQARLLEKQLDLWRTTRGKNKRGIDPSLIHIVTVAPKYEKSDLSGATYFHPDDVLEFSISHAMQVRHCAADIIENAPSLIEVRGATYADIELVRPEHAHHRSLVIDSWNNDCQYHDCGQHYLEHCAPAGCTEITINDALDRNHESCYPIAPRATPLITKLSVGTIDDPTPVREPFWTGTADALTDLTFYLSRWFESEEEDENGVKLNTGNLLLEPCPNLRRLTFSVDTDGMSQAAIIQFLKALATVESLIFDTTMLLSSRQTRKIAESLTIVAEQLTDEETAPNLTSLRLHISQKIPERGTTTALGRAVDALRLACDQRVIQLELVRGSTCD